MKKADAVQHPRALHYIGEVLLQNALVYSAWPPGTWREINAIYAYASQNRIHQIPVKAEDGRSGTPNTTIEDLFKGLMLFASATPHRLRQSHAKLLFAYLEPWSAYTMILTDDDFATIVAAVICLIPRSAFAGVGAAGTGLRRLGSPLSRRQVRPARRMRSPGNRSRGQSTG